MHSQAAFLLFVSCLGMTFCYPQTKATKQSGYLGLVVALWSKPETHTRHNEIVFSYCGLAIINYINVQLSL